MWKQLLVGALVGACIAKGMLELTNDPLLYLVGMVSLVVSLYLHIIIHEGGHLVAGLMSGYKFVSFRIGNIIWIKRQGKIKRKKFSIPGTAGQCLLDPPDTVNGNYHSKFYNTGGGFFNLLFAFTGLLIGLSINNECALVITLPFAVVGIFLAITNLVPMKVGGIANDGYNLKAFQSNEESRKAFWVQLKINKLQSEGMRLKDIPEEYFSQATLKEEGNPLIDAIKIFRFQRYLDEKEFFKAEMTGVRILELDGILSYYKNMVSCELLYLALINHDDEIKIRAIYNKTLEKYMKTSKTTPSVLRAKYAYEVLYNHDEEAANKVLARYNKCIKDYPMAGEILMERELMEEIR